MDISLNETGEGVIYVFKTQERRVYTNALYITENKSDQNPLGYQIVLSLTGEV